jgi:hypothetical protein
MEEEEEEEEEAHVVVPASCLAVAHRLPRAWSLWL